VDRLDAPGLLIGLEAKADFGCEQTVLEPGDVLLCYTDGVTEAAGISGERFEEHRLLASLQDACRAGLGAKRFLTSSSPVWIVSSAAIGPWRMTPRWWC
jgi:sigma-B regulation protein RsbU (phosphoserine phosphatase)